MDAAVDAAAAGLGVAAAALPSLEGAAGVLVAVVFAVGAAAAAAVRLEGAAVGVAGTAAAAAGWGAPTRFSDVAGCCVALGLSATAIGLATAATARRAAGVPLTGAAAGLLLLTGFPALFKLLPTGLLGLLLAGTVALARVACSGC